MYFEYLEMEWVANLLIFGTIDGVKGSYILFTVFSVWEIQAS